MRKLIHRVLGLDPGHIVVTDILVDAWGSEVVFDCIYEYPPRKLGFRLIFSDCRSIEWFVQHTGARARDMSVSQLITHDLGAGRHERTARMATVMAELIISYGNLKVERDTDITTDD
ncbi:MAG: hypothetical protein AAFQ07_05275 [Chloroflexota bacterium]